MLVHGRIKDGKIQGFGRDRKKKHKKQEQHGDSQTSPPRATSRGHGAHGLVSPAPAVKDGQLGGGLGHALGNDEVGAAAQKMAPRSKSVRVLLGQNKLNVATVQIMAKAGQTQGKREISWGAKMWSFFNDPWSSSGAFKWSIWILFLIVASSACFILESLPDFCCGRYDFIWDPIEWVCIVFFSIEYVIRITTCPITYGAHPDDEMDEMSDVKNEVASHGAMDGTSVEVEEGRKDDDNGALEHTWANAFKARARFFFGFLNMVDFVSIIPFYITKLIEMSGEANAGSFSFLRVIRLARVFRLLKLSKYSEGLQLLGNTLARSMPALGMLMAFESIYIIILSTAVYMVERGQYCDEVCPGDCDGYCFGTATKGSGWYAVIHTYTGATYSRVNANASEPFIRDKSVFENIFMAAYWSVTTMTTTGYGDAFPQTALGKLLGCLTMLSGLVVLALPITVISENFAHAYQSQEKKQQKQREAEMQDPKWLSMTTKYIVKFIEDAKVAPETGTIIPHPAMLIDEETDDQLIADSLAKEFDELDEISGFQSPDASMTTVKARHRHSSSAGPAAMSHSIQPIPESERELASSNQSSRAVDSEKKSMRLRGPPTAESMEQSVLTDTIRSNLSAHIMQRSGTGSPSTESLGAETIERTASATSSSAFESGQVSDAGIRSPVAMRTPDPSGASAVMRGNSNSSNISSANSRGRRESTASLIVRRGSMGDGGLRGSRGGEKNHDVFSRTKQKVKALIEAHKLLLVEDLQEVMSRSSQAIYDAVVEEVFIQSAGTMKMNVAPQGAQAAVQDTSKLHGIAEASPDSEESGSGTQPASQGGSQGVVMNGNGVGGGEEGGGEDGADDVAKAVDAGEILSPVGEAVLSEDKGDEAAGMRPGEVVSPSGEGEEDRGKQDGET